MKKGTLSFIIILVLFMGALPADGENRHNDGETLSMSFVFPEVMVGEKEGYTLLEMDGSFVFSAVPSEPRLPYRAEVITFPFGTHIDKVEVAASEVNHMHLSHKIAPAPHPVPLNMVHSKGEVEEGRVYESDEVYPMGWVTWHTGAGIKNGERAIFLSFQVFPCRYSPADNDVLYIDEITITVEYSTPELPLLQNDDYELLIIAPSEYVNALEPLVAHKNSWGVSTLLTSLTSIRAYQGRDDAEKMKNFIRDTVEKWGVRYVLLVGNARKMPVRYAYINDGTETHHLTDLYYADIYDAEGEFSSWDSNGNDVFGEYQYRGETDDIDFYPDVYVGRLACASKAEVTTVVNKIIAYENAAAQTDWFNKAVLCAGDSFEDDDDVYEGEYTKERVETYLEGFEVTPLFTSLGTLDTAGIIEQISLGAGYVDFSGHGNRLSWATHPPGKYDEWIGIGLSDVTRLSNGEMLPIVVLDACSTGKFDDGNCLAWHFVKTTNKGSIATFAATALGWGYIGSDVISGLSGYMDVRLASHLSDEHTGEMWAHSIEDYLSRTRMEKLDYKTIEEWMLFGDPTLKIGGYEGASIGLSKPKPGYLYLYNNELRQTFRGNTVILGSLDMEVSATEGIETVEFYVDGELRYTDEDAPFSWHWDERIFWRHMLTAIGYGDAGEVIERTTDVMIFHL